MHKQMGTLKYFSALNWKKLIFISNKKKKKTAYASPIVLIFSMPFSMHKTSNIEKHSFNVATNKWGLSFNRKQSEVKPTMSLKATVTFK